jgi:dTDP-4-dehydrorhamnose reductase
MRNLIVGGSSKIGKVLSLTNSKCVNTYFTNKIEGGIYLDLTKEITSQIDLDKFDNIIILSSVTDPKKCEEDPDYSNLLNVISTKNLINICAKKKKKVIFFSSDYVFDGKKGKYTEKDTPNPINLYGEQKFEIEKYIHKNLEDFSILRIAKTYFDDLQTPCFLKNIYEQVKKNKDEINCIDKQLFSPICSTDISEIINRIIKLKVPILHVGGPKIFDRKEIIKLVMIRLNKELKINFIKRDTVEVESMFNWPIDVSLDISELLKIKKNFVDINTVLEKND